MSKSIIIKRPAKNIFDIIFTPYLPELKIFLVICKFNKNKDMSTSRAKGLAKPSEILDRPIISSKLAKSFLSTKPAKIAAKANSIVIIDLNIPPMVVKNLVVFFIMPPFILL